MIMEIPELRFCSAGVRDLGRTAMTFMLGCRRGLGRVHLEMGRECRDDDITTFDYHGTNGFNPSFCVEAGKAIGGRFSV